MNICPNFNDPVINSAWDAIAKNPELGEFEAAREFLRSSINNVEMRTPDEILTSKAEQFTPRTEKEIQARIERDNRKLATKTNDPTVDNSETLLGRVLLDSDVNVQSLSTNDNSLTRAQEFISKFTSAMPIEAQTVTPEQAAVITGSAINPYNPKIDYATKPAFFYGNTVYFVQGMLSTENVFHEFSHPVVKTIMATNPKLFESLVRDALAADPSLLESSINEYSDFRAALQKAQTKEQIQALTSSLGKAVSEEVLVKALTKAAMLKEQNYQASSAFQKAITNILAAIKQVFRKLFGQKINIAKLSETTTLDELAEMLHAGGNFEISTNNVSQKDIVNYIQTNEEFLKDIEQATEEVGNKKMGMLVRRMYEGAVEQIQRILKNKNYNAMLELLVDEYNRGDLQEIRANLSKYARELESKTQNLIDEMQDVQARSYAILSSMQRLEKMMKSIENQLKNIKNDPEEKDAITKAYYFTHVIDYWEKYINDAISVMNEANIDTKSPVLVLMNSIKTYMDRSGNHINEMTTKGMGDVLWEEWEIVAARAREKFHSMIDTLKEKGASQYKIDKEYISFYGMNEAEHQRYTELKEIVDSGRELYGEDEKFYNAAEKQSLNGLNLTEDKINKTLKGMGRDTNPYNAFLEGYLYSTDPVIGGFAMFYKRNMTEMENRTMSRYNDIVDELQPLIEAAGIKFNVIGEFGKTIGFKDKIAVRDKNNNVVEQEVYTLLNAWKNYRYTIDKYRIEIENLRIKYLRSGSKEDQLNLATAIAERKKHINQWFYGDFVDEFIKRDDKILTDQNGNIDPIGVLAWDTRTRIIEKLKEIQSEHNDEDSDIRQAKIKAELRNYSELYSLTNYDGSPKTGDELLMAQKLIQHRNETKKFYEWRPRKGVFQSTLLKYEQKIYDKLKKTMIPGSTEFNNALEQEMNKWIMKNTRRSIMPKFYEDKAQIILQLDEILARPINRIKDKILAIEAVQNPSQSQLDELNKLRDYLTEAEQRVKELDFKDAYNTIMGLNSGFKDDDGQPIADEMKPGAIESMKKAHEEIVKVRKKWARNTGLTAQEYHKLNKLKYKIFTLKKFTNTDLLEYNKIFEKQNFLGLNGTDQADLAKQYALLNELESKVPTSYYLNKVNKWIDIIADSKVNDLLGLNGEELDETTIQRLYDTDVLTALFDVSPAFESWFKKNHYVGQAYEENVGMVDKFMRVSAWNVLVPNNPSYLEHTKITRLDGRSYSIEGKPSQDYFSRQVKKEYRVGYDPNIVNPDGTKGAVRKIVGVHIDNQGEPLPKDVPDSPYRNELYHDLKNKAEANPESQDAKIFKILQVITKHHLKNQEGLNAKNKLYLDFPRYKMSTLETIQSTGLRGIPKMGDPFSRMINKIKDFFYGARNQADPSSFNWKDENMLVRAASYDDQVENIPIQGLFNLRLEETSTDIITSMFRYMYSAEHHKQLVKMNPYAIALKNILNNPNNKIKEPNMVNMNLFKNLGNITYLNKKGKYVRADAFNNFYNREFLGQTTAGFGKDEAWVLNFQKALMSGASTAFFAFNIPSAIKNAAGFKFQSMIMAAAGKDINFRTLAMGEAWSTKYMTELSFSQAYRQGKGSLSQQLVESMDPVQGRFEEKFGTAFTRTLFKDVTSKGVLFNFRKWVEIQATVQTFAAMMYKQQVKMGDNYINYMDAWELNKDGKLQLKEGVDPKWGITYDEEGKQVLGKEYVLFRNRMHQVMNKLAGAYSKMDQPEAGRYIAFRFVSFLRRYFTTMALNRFGTRRWNPGYGDIDQGYWVRSVKALLDLIKTRNVNDLTPEDKKAFIQMATEIFGVAAMGLLVGILFGFDPDDEEKYEKIRQRSGALPILGVAEDDERQFNVGGFLGLHALNLLAQVKAENEQFIPFPGYGLNNVKSLLDLKSLAFGPTIDTYGKILSNLGGLWSDDERYFYKRRVGPYEWQDQGSLKLWAHIAKMGALTGANIDPGQTFINFQKAQQLGTYK